MAWKLAVIAIADNDHAPRGGDIIAICPHPPLLGRSWPKSRSEAPHQLDALPPTKPACVRACRFSSGHERTVTPDDVVCGSSRAPWLDEFKKEMRPNRCAVTGGSAVLSRLARRSRNLVLIDGLADTSWDQPGCRAPGASFNTPECELLCRASTCSRPASRLSRAAALLARQRPPISFL